MKRDIFPVKKSQTHQVIRKPVPPPPSEIITTSMTSTSTGFCLQTVHDQNGSKITITGQNLLKKQDIEFSLIPEDINKLLIPNCHLHSIFIHFNSLSALDVSNNKLTTLPPLPASLLRLNIRNNQITALDLSKTHLTSLDCALNFPLEIQFPPHLELLILSKFQLSTVDISSLKSLTELILLPQEDFTELIKQKLKIYNYPEIEFSVPINLKLFHTTTVQKLNFPLQINKFSAKNCEVAAVDFLRIIGLKEVILDQNLIHFEDCVLPAGIEQISCSDCNLNFLDFRKFTNLRVLNGAMNVCKEVLLPEGLVSLNVSGNKFLIKMSFLLPKIQVFNVENCKKLKIRAEDLGVGLKELNLSKTNVKYIDLNRFKNLEKCSLQGNQMEYLVFRNKNNVNVSGSSFKYQPITSKSGVTGLHSENAIKIPRNCIRMLKYFDQMQNSTLYERKKELTKLMEDLYAKMQKILY